MSALPEIAKRANSRFAPRFGGVGSPSHLSEMPTIQASGAPFPGQWVHWRFTANWVGDSCRWTTHGCRVYGLAVSRQLAGL